MPSIFEVQNDADMEITVLDIQILKALHREVKEVSLLIEEITKPYKALQQATKWLDQQEACQLLNISKRTLQTYRAKGILGATQINRKTYFRLSEVELLMQGCRLPQKQYGLKVDKMFNFKTVKDEKEHIQPCPDCRHFKRV